MTISDFHASTIVKAKAYFGLDGFACDPDEITRRLAIQPDEIRRKDEIRVGRDGRDIHQPFNTWGLESRVESKDVNDHIRDLLRRLTGVNAEFLSEFGEPYFSVLWKSNYLYAGNGPFYEADVVAGMARLNATLYQDIYQVDEEPEVAAPADS